MGQGVKDEEQHGTKGEHRTDKMFSFRKFICCAERRGQHFLVVWMSAAEEPQVVIASFSCCRRRGGEEERERKKSFVCYLSGENRCDAYPPIRFFFTSFISGTLKNTNRACYKRTRATLSSAFYSGKGKRQKEKKRRNKRGQVKMRCNLDIISS
jgi:hypothetical protein